MDKNDMLLGELKEFKNMSIARFDKIESKLESLSSFRWRAAGALAAVFIIGELVHLAKAFTQ